MTSTSRRARPNPGFTTLSFLALTLMSLLLAASSAVQARTFAPVGLTKGLGARVVLDVMLDSRGFLWVASREGLFRYDGYEARAYLPDSANPASISAADISVVYEAADGIIWVGTNTGGVDRFDPATGVFSNYRRDSGDAASLSDDSVQDIAEGPLGHLWVATSKGLSRLDHGTGQFEHFAAGSKRSAALSARAADLHLGASETLWVGTMGAGVSRWNPDGEGFSHYDLAELTSGPNGRNHVLSIHEDRDGIVWAGTREGLVRLDADAGIATFVDLGEQDGYPPVITAIEPEGDGRLWLATRSRGLLTVERSSGEWRAVGSEAASPAGGLPGDALMSLEMGAGQVFVGTWGSGVFRAPLQETRFELLNMKTAGGLTNDVITAVMATAEPGRPWLGSFGGGPQHADVGARLITAKPIRRHQMREAGVLDLAGPVNGRLYAGTTHGLYEFSADGTQVALFQHQPDVPGGIGEGYVQALLPDAESGLWIGLGGSGLYFFDTITQQFSGIQNELSRADSLGGDFVTALLGDPAGYLWVGTRSNGLNRCSLDPWSCERFDGREKAETGLSHHHVTTLYRDRRGRVWAGTDGGGLNLALQNEDGAVSGFRHWRVEQGLLDDGIMGIEEDLDESLWLSSRNGLSRLDPATGEVSNFVAASGLPVSHFNSGASDADAEYLYFGSTDGLLVVPRGTLLMGRKPADIRITSVTHAARGGIQEEANLSERRLRLPYGQVITVEMAVLDYAETAHEYAYRMSGTDPWIPLGKQRRILFHGLEPGQHDLQVRGRDAHGLWGNSDSLTLEIIPPFWMTSWFRGLVALLLVLLALAVHFTRQAVVRRRAGEQLRLSETRERALEEKLGTQAELAVLTPRQKEILQLVAEGRSTREIAELLGVSIKTVEAHRANLMERLQIHDVPGLVRLAIRSGLIPLEN